MDYSNFEPTVNLSVTTLIKECSKNPNYADNYFCDFSLINRKNVHDVFCYKKFNDDFTSYLTCYNDGNYFIGTIRPCYEEFLYKLQILLNVKPKKDTKDDENLTKKLNGRLKILANISTEYELKNKFPLLYKDLINGRRYIRSIENLKKFDESTYRKQIDYYYSCALRRKLDRFILTQVELYRRLINKRFQYKEKVENTNYNSYIKKRFDMDKVAMYTAHECLRICEDETDRKTIQCYLTYLDKYLASDYQKDVSLTTVEGVHLDIQSITNRITNIKNNLEGINTVDWVILPSNENNSNIYFFKKKPKKFNVDYEELERLRRKGERKKRFYSGTNYLAKAIGLLKYQGYCAHIYANGEVILDREYEENNPSTAQGDAIYNIKAYDFETLSKLDKSVLRKHPRVKKINHSKTWEERIRIIINKEGTKEEKESALTLIKKLKTKKEQ